MSPTTPQPTGLARPRRTALLTVLAGNAVLLAAWVSLGALTAGDVDEGWEDLVLIAMVAFGLMLATVSTVAGLIAGFLITNRGPRWRSATAISTPRAIRTGIVATLLGLLPVPLVFLGLLATDLL